MDSFANLAVATSLRHRILTLAAEVRGGGGRRRRGFEEEALLVLDRASTRMDTVIKRMRRASAYDGEVPDMLLPTRPASVKEEAALLQREVEKLRGWAMGDVYKRRRARKFQRARELLDEAEKAGREDQTRLLIEASSCTAYEALDVEEDPTDPFFLLDVDLATAAEIL